MVETQHSTWNDADQKSIREELERILRSGPFHQSRRRQQFLEYLVNETLAGRAERLKAYTIAVEVLERPASFDPLVDPVVRIEAGRLRDKLREYYEGEGRDDLIRIELPKGSYAPVIRLGRCAVAEAQPSQAVQSAVDEAEPIGWRQYSIPSNTGTRWRIVLPAVALMFLIFVAVAWPPREKAAPLPVMPSIAVLPFDNLGDDAKWDRFADGITEDIITDLARFRNLDIIARNSTAAYKGKALDVRQIGRELNVRYVMEGSIQPTGERIRVTAQLIEAASGSHVWTERFDRPADDLFAVQNEVTQRIAATLGGYQGAVEEAERSLVRRKPPASLTAYDTYLIAMDMKHTVTKDSLIEAEGLYRKALELDPQLARAYVGLTDVYFYLIDLGLTPSLEETRSKMVEAAKMAVQFDPNDAKTHLALGNALITAGKPEQAAAEIARAESLAPSDADVLLIIAWTIPALGESERALGLAERALTLNPHYPSWYDQGLSYVYFFGGQFDKAVKYRLLVKEPLALDYAFLAMSYAYLGRTNDAAAAAAKVTKLDPSWNAERYLSDGGGYTEKAAELFVGGARKAAIPACMPAGKLKDMPNLIRVRSCDEQRAKLSAG